MLFMVGHHFCICQWSPAVQRGGAPPFAQTEVNAGQKEDFTGGQSPLRGPYQNNINSWGHAEWTIAAGLQ